LIAYTHRRPLGSPIANPTSRCNPAR
jgi:hypothetical protein